MAKAVAEELPTEECLVDLILEKMSETTPGTSYPRVVSIVNPLICQKCWPFTGRGGNSEVLLM